MSENKLTNDEYRVREAKKEDMAAVVEMIQELADFEKMPTGPKLSVQDLERDGFDVQPPLFRCKVLEVGEKSRSPSLGGYALYFPTYSTWEGRAMMLEDLYVRPALRKRGLGKMLFNAIAQETHSAGCSRLDFHVLSWNPARAFYAARGAVDLTQTDQWCFYRLSGDRLVDRASVVNTHD